MKVTTFVITLPEGVLLEHLYESFLAHDTLLHYHRALAKNDIVSYGPFEEASPEDVGEKQEEGGSSGEGSSSSVAAASTSAVRDPALPFFRRKASVVMPLAAPRPLQIAIGTSVIKLRLKQSVAVLRRAKIVDEDIGGEIGEIGEIGKGGGKNTAAAAAALAPLDVIEFRSAPRLWVPEAKDLPLGKISLVASYEDVTDEKKSQEASEGSAAAEAASASASAPAASAAPPLVDPGVTPFHLSPRRTRSRSVSVAGNEHNNSPAPIRQRIRIDVTATADFQPEGWMATFKRPLESVMLAMVTKSARGMANWFAACAASDAGVGPKHPDLSRMPGLVKPRLPRELIYLETRRLSVDGPPGISRGLTVDEAEELQESAARGSERASAVAAAAAAAAAAVVAAEVAAENNKKEAVSSGLAAAAAPSRPPPPPALPSSFEEPVTPDREIGANSLTRVSLASSVAESFHSAASELERASLSLSDGGGGGEEEGKPSGAAAAAAAQPATPARGASSDGRVTVSLGGSSSSSSSKRVLRMPRWLVPGGTSGGGGGGGGGGAAAAPPRRSRSSASLAEQANGAPSSSSSSSSSSRPKSAPGGSFKEREQAQQQQQQPVRRPVLAWLRPKSARAEI